MFSFGLGAMTELVCDMAQICYPTVSFGLGAMTALVCDMAQVCYPT